MAKPMTRNTAERRRRHQHGDKGGTNQLHGSAYEYMKRPSLNATSFSNNAKGLGPRQHPARSIRIYGGRAGLHPEAVQRQGQDLLLQRLGAL